MPWLVYNNFSLQALIHSIFHIQNVFLRRTFLSMFCHTYGKSIVADIFHSFAFSWNHLHPTSLVFKEIVVTSRLLFFDQRGCLWIQARCAPHRAGPAWCFKWMAARRVTRMKDSQKYESPVATGWVRSQNMWRISFFLLQVLFRRPTYHKYPQKRRSAFWICHSSKLSPACLWTIPSLSSFPDSWTWNLNKLDRSAEVLTLSMNFGNWRAGCVCPAVPINLRWPRLVSIVSKGWCTMVYKGEMVVSLYFILNSNI